MADCLSLEQLEVVATGRNVPADTDEHATTCSQCRATLARIRENNALMAEMTALEATARKPAESAVLPDSFRGYRVISELHRGGQGVIYLAIQQGTQRKVAIKVPTDGPLAGADGHARFQREIQILAHLDHPHIVTIHDSGLADGRFFYVMDYVAGPAFDEYVSRRLNSGRPMLDLFARICEAVNAAHLRGVIHRDLKPANIRIDERGEPRVLDFGLARFASDGVRGEVMTMTGQFIGSLPWASPEQAEGNPARIDIRTDVYSLGVMLYQLLSGRFPHDVTGTSRAILDRIQTEEPTPLRSVRPDIDDEVATIVAKCLAKDPARRYQSAGALASDIRRHLAGEAIEAKRDSGWYVLKKNLRRCKAPVTIAAAFILLITLGLAASLTLWRRAASERNSAAAARELADGERDAANAARQLAETEKAGAESAREETRRLLYVSHMGAAMTAWEDANITGLRDLLRRYRPKPDEPDLRDFAWYYLLRLWKSTQTPMIEQGSGLLRFSVCFSPETKVLASAFENGGVRGWNMNNHREIPLSSHKGLISGYQNISISRDGGTLGLITSDQKVIVSPLQGSGKPQVSFDVGEPIHAVALSTDGGILALGGRQVRLKYLHNDRVATLAKGLPWTSKLAFSPDDRMVASGDLDGTVIIWDVDNRKEKHRFKHDGLVLALAFSPDSTLLASGGYDRTARLWDVTSGEEKATLRGHTDDVFSVAFSPDGKTLAVGSQDATITLWSVDSGQHLTTLKGHSSDVDLVAFFDNHTLISRDQSTIKSWPLSADLEMGVINVSSSVSSGAFSASGKTLAFGTHSGEVGLYDIPTGGLRLLKAHSQYAHRLVFSGDSLLTSASHDELYGSLKLWNLTTEAAEVLGQRKTGYRALALSPDGSVLALSSAGKRTIELWDLPSRSFLRSIPGHVGGAWALAFSPDSTILASGAGDGLVKRWNVNADLPIKNINPRAGRITSIAFSSDERTLAYGCWDGTIRLWDRNDEAERYVLKGHRGHVNSLDFAPNRKTLASAGDDKTIRLWDVEIAEPTIVLTGHRDSVNFVAFSPDGLLLASGGWDGDVRLWRRASEAEARKAGW